MKATWSVSRKTESSVTVFHMDYGKDFVDLWFCYLQLGKAGVGDVEYNSLVTVPTFINAIDKGTVSFGRQ